MGEKNEVICSYLSRPDIFADFINGSVFCGKQVLSAEELESLQYTGKESHETRKGSKVQKLRIRDVAKVRTQNEQYAIIAIENQDELHYFMPFRCMEYDAEDYARQIRRLEMEHKQMADLDSGAEYLSGVKKSDKLKPVITFVFYHGKGVWNTCRQLHDMIDFSEENEILKEYTSNYRTNIVSLQDMDENCFQTGLHELIGMMKRKDDKTQMREFYRANRARFQNVDEDTYDTISVMTDRKNLLKYKKASQEKKGTVDMCRAFDELEKEWFQEGKIEGEQKFALLVGKLLADGRIEELRIASVDDESRRKLYDEYGLDISESAKLQ